MVVKLKSASWSEPFVSDKFSKYKTNRKRANTFPQNFIRRWEMPKSKSDLHTDVLTGIALRLNKQNKTLHNWDFEMTLHSTAAQKTWSTHASDPEASRMTRWITNTLLLFSSLLQAPKTRHCCCLLPQSMSSQDKLSSKVIRYVKIWMSLYNTAWFGRSL